MEVETKIKTLEEIYQDYKAEGDLGLGDKGGIHDYLPSYEKLLAPYRDKPIVLFEIGTNQCHGLKMFREYFTENACISGCDIWEGSKNFVTTENIIVLHGDATQKSFADTVGAGIDILIDDGSHMMDDQLLAFELFSPKMNKGGIYIIEDLINFDAQKPIFEEMGFEVLDLRANKGRWDDALAIKHF